MPKPTDYDKTHLRNLTAICTRIDRIFQKAAEEAAKIGVTITNPLPEDKIFSFDDYPATQKQIERLLNALQESMQTTIVNGVRSAWTLSNNKNNALVSRIFGDRVGDLSKEQYRRYFSTNGAALDAFLGRKEQGMNLSDRVWRYTNAFKHEIELGLDLGIRTGESAAKMTRSLRKYLQHPDKMFRRVRDKHGNLRLSKAAQAFNPGRGVYRSSYKNARRLAATETNMAYRTSDHLRWQQMDFVVGIEIKLSNNHTLNGMPLTDICDELKGKYPKEFKFVGWHPHCRCHAVTILKTEEEMQQDTQRILAGEKPEKGSVNTVRDVPSAFKDWVEEHSERIKMGGNLPYFVKDNIGMVRPMLDLDKPIKIGNKEWTLAKFFGLSKKTPQEIAIERHAKRDADKIQQAWNARRIAKIEESVKNGILPKECLTGLSELKQEELNARISFLQKTAARHAARTSADVINIQFEWSLRRANRINRANISPGDKERYKALLKMTSNARKKGFNIVEFNTQYNIIMRHARRTKADIDKIRQRLDARYIEMAGEKKQLDAMRKALEKKKITGIADVQRIMDEFYNQFPEEFNYTRIKFIGFNRPPRNGTFTHAYSKHNKEIAFNSNKGWDKESPLETITKALNKMRNKKKLNIEELRRVKTIVHELLHQKAAKHVSLKQHGYGDFKRTAMETMNELAARSTTTRFIRRLGGNTDGVEQIITKGDGYTLWVNRVLGFCEKAGVNPERLGQEWAKTLTTERYDTMDAHLYAFFKKHADKKGFTQSMSEVLAALEDKKSTLEWDRMIRKWFLV